MATSFERRYEMEEFDNIDGVDKVKSLESSKEVDSYYKKEGNKIADNLTKFRLKKINAKISLHKKKIKKFDDSLSNFDSIEKDVKSHLDLLKNKKLEIVSLEKEATAEKKELDSFKANMKLMIKKSEEFSKLKSQLVNEELKLITELESMATNSRLKYSGLPLSGIISNLQKSKKNIELSLKKGYAEDFSELHKNSEFLDKLIDPIQKKEIEVRKKRLEMEKEFEKSKTKIHLLKEPVKKAKRGILEEEKKIKLLEEQKLKFEGKEL